MRTCSLSLLGLELLDLVGSWLLEVDGDLVGGQSSVGIGHGLDLALNIVSVHWVEEDSLGAALSEGDSGGSSDDGGWDNNVVEEGKLDSLEGPGSWSLLGWVGLLYNIQTGWLAFPYVKF